VHGSGEPSRFLTIPIVVFRHSEVRSCNHLKEDDKIEILRPATSTRRIRADRHLLVIVGPAFSFGSTLIFFGASVPWATCQPSR
jgi:hypothetical protein